jgi:hypothetical protein
MALKILVFVRILFVGKLTKWERNITSRGVAIFNESGLDWDNSGICIYAILAFMLTTNF